MSKYLPEITRSRGPAEVVCGAAVKRDPAQTAKEVPSTFSPTTTTSKDLKASYHKLPPISSKQFTTSDGLIHGKKSSFGKNELVPLSEDDSTQNASGTWKPRKDGQKRNHDHRTNTRTPSLPGNNLGAQDHTTCTSSRKPMVNNKGTLIQRSRTQTADPAQVLGASTQAFTPKPPDKPKNTVQRARVGSRRLSGGSSTIIGLQKKNGKTESLSEEDHKHADQGEEFATRFPPIRVNHTDTVKRGRVPNRRSSSIHTGYNVQEKGRSKDKILGHTVNSSKKNATNAKITAISKNPLTQKYDTNKCTEKCKAFTPRPLSKDKEPGQLKRCVKHHVATAPSADVKKEADVREDNATTYYCGLTKNELRSLPLKVLGQGAPAQEFYKDAAPKAIVEYKQCRNADLDILDIAIILKNSMHLPDDSNMEANDVQE